VGWRVGVIVIYLFVYFYFRPIEHHKWIMDVLRDYNENNSNEI